MIDDLNIMFFVERELFMCPSDRSDVLNKLATLMRCFPQLAALFK